MDISELKTQANRICDLLIKHCNYEGDSAAFAGAWTEAYQFISDYGGKESSFLKLIEATDPLRDDSMWVANNAKNAVQSVMNYIEAGLNKRVSLERQAQIDVVSDILEQATILLGTKNTHPAAAAVLVGASLEEFLRNWVEAEDLLEESSKMNIDTYTKLLRSNESITKQDVKDITSWAGTRNDAAHGHWDEVSDKNKISLMLEGINLFMRKYSPQKY